MGNDSHVCKWTSVYFFNILQFSKTWSWPKHLFISHYLVTLVFKIDLSASWSWSRPCHGTNICSWSMASWRIINLAILRKKVQNGMVLLQHWQYMLAYQETIIISCTRTCWKWNGIIGWHDGTGRRSVPSANRLRTDSFRRRRWPGSGRMSFPWFRERWRPRGDSRRHSNHRRTLGYPKEIVKITVKFNLIAKKENNWEHLKSFIKEVSCSSSRETSM